MNGDVTVLRPSIQRANRVDDRAHATAGQGRREFVDDCLHVAAANLSQPFGCEPRPCVAAQALVDVVDRARLVPAAVLIQRAALARRGYEARTGLVKSDTPLRLQGASVELAFQVRAGIARRLERGHKTGLDGTPPAWVPAHAEVRRLAVAARRPVGVEGAALLMTGEDSAGSGLRIYPGMPGMTLRRPASLATVLDDPSLKF